MEKLGVCDAAMYDIFNKIRGVATIVAGMEIKMANKSHLDEIGKHTVGVYVYLSICSSRSDQHVSIGAFGCPRSIKSIKLCRLERPTFVI